MFYSHNILSKRHGKFGTIWIAATKAVTPSRREYMAVNLPKSCEDIIRMITLRAEPFVIGGARPRLSLYLSSQLMFGCVKVYNKQNDYLISDLVELNMRFRSSLADALPIDLAPPSEKAFREQMLVDVPMSPSLMDPDFGRLRHEKRGDVSLDFIPEVEVWQPLPEAVSPARGRPDIPLPQTPLQPHRTSPPDSTRRPQPYRPGLDESLQANAADITLIEEPVPPRPMGSSGIDHILRPGELDLPPLTAEALAELDAAGEAARTRETERDDAEEPRRKRPRRASVAMTPVYVGASGDAEERQRQLTLQQQEFEARLEEQQRIIDEILQRNDGSSQDMEADDAEALQRERRKLHQMQQEFDESLRQAEFEAEMREAESGAEQQQAGMGFYQPDADLQTSAVDQVQLLQPVTDATMQDDGRLAPADETPAVMLGIPPDQIDILPQQRGQPTPGVTPGSPIVAPVDERRRRREEYNLQLSPIATVGQVTPRHRRQLRFADAEIRLKRDVIYDNLHSGHETSKPNEIPDVNFRSVTNLFDNPTRGLSKRFKRLWKRNAITKEVATDQEDKSVWGVPGLVSSSESDSDRTPLARQLDDLTLSPVRPTDEEQQQQQIQEEREAQLQMDQMEMQDAQQMAPDVSGSEVGRDVTREVSGMQESIEGARDASKSRSSVDDISSGNVMRPEATPGSEDRPSSRRSRKSSPEDAPVKSTTVTPDVAEMTIIQEERELQASPVLPPGPTTRPAPPGGRPTIQLEEDLESSEIRNRLEQIIRVNTEYEDVTTFKDVCPTSNHRKTAALMFSALLGLCKRQKVVVRQRAPYADIYIARGEKFNE